MPIKYHIKESKSKKGLKMREVKGYQIIGDELWKLNDNIALWECQKDNSSFEILTIARNKEYNSLLDRLLKSDIRPLIDSDIPEIQRILECGEDEEESVYYIVYESLDDYSPFHPDTKLSAFRDILTALDKLKKKNLEAHIIFPDSILVDGDGNAKLQFAGLFELFARQKLLNEAYLPQEVKDYLNDKEKSCHPNFQDDIFSVVKTFEPILQALDDERANEILNRALTDDRQKRFSKYRDIFNLVDGIDYKPEFTKVLKIGVSPEKRDEFSPIFEEMNKKCYMTVEDKLSEGRGDITGHFSTDNWHGRFFINQSGYDCGIRVCSLREGAHEKMDRYSDKWFLADFSFSYDDNSTNFDVFGIFKEKFLNQNQLANLNKTKRGTVSKWQTLPKNEKDYIEENAFRAKYHKVEYRKANVSAGFYLNDNFKNWEKIKELKNEGAVLSVEGVRVDPEGNAENVSEKIGKIGDFYSEGGVITVKGILCEDWEIPKEGELFEDVRQKVSQYKKQLEACQKFNSQDVENPDICSILATPDTAKIPDNDKIWDGEYEDFKENVFDKKLKADDTQREAVLEALSYKPLYLIQGPPGTGKTTVIVELIRQIIEREGDAKILVTSQSNLAVDNVLKRINDINNINRKEGRKEILFMRLASEGSDDKEINVIEPILPHTYEAKLGSWIADTVKRSDEYLAGMLQEQSGGNKPPLVDFYRDLAITTMTFDEFRQKLGKRVNYVKRLFENVKDIDDVKRVFTNELGDEFLKFVGIQRDWSAFVRNAMPSPEKNRSMLNRGHEQVDFLTAMMEKTNVIGATCIHIASSKYSKVNFKFDYVIMDESSKASPAEAIVPIIMGKSIVLIGDHKQLPPVVTREEAVRRKIRDQMEDNGLDVEKEFGESLFETLIKAFEKREGEQKYIKMLDIQYRMPKQVGSLISKYFYDGKLKNPATDVIPDFDESKHHGLTLKKNTSIIFMSTSKFQNCRDNGNKYKRQNKCNADMIKDILARLNKLYAGNLLKKEPFTIGIIAGYRGQVELLKSTVNLSQYENFVIPGTNDNRGSQRGSDNSVDKNKDTASQKLIEINTIDRFQGAERDIIIYDIVRSATGRENIGFLDDYRRINVAFSRVKRLLIVVGDSEFLIKRATLNPGGKFKDFKLQQIAQELQENGLIFHSLNEVF